MLDVAAALLPFAERFAMTAAAVRRSPKSTLNSFSLSAKVSTWPFENLANRSTIDKIIVHPVGVSL